MNYSIAWNAVEKYFTTNKYFITKHHLDSYNDFIDNIIPKTITSMNPIVMYKYDANNPDVLKHKVEVVVGGADGQGIYFDHPSMVKDDKHYAMFPNDARLNDMTYGSQMYCDIDVNYYNNGGLGKTTRFEKVKIGMIPIMLHSKLCNLAHKNEHFLKEAGECFYDQGGYFVVDGQEKVIITQERNITNRIFITRWKKDEKYTYTAFIRCTSEKSSVFPKKVDFKVYSGDYMQQTRRNAIVVEVPHIKSEIPLFILFRALGVENDKSILSYILGTEDFENEETSLLVDFLYASLTDGNMCYTKDQALEYLKSFTDFKTKENVEYVLMKNLFPNIEFDYSILDKNINNDDVDLLFHNSKALFLGYVTQQLVKVCLGIKKETDRDSFILKRVAVSGFMLGDIFKDFYNMFRNHLRNKIDQFYESGKWNLMETVDNLVHERNKHEVFIPEFITKGMMRSLKGSWGINREQSGIVQDINRISYISYISHMANLTSPMDSEIKIRSPHTLSGNQYGITCPCNTPDGASIGLIKHFTLMFHVSFYVPSEPIIQAILAFFPMTFLEKIAHGVGVLSSQKVKVMVNNTWVGIIDQEHAPRLTHYLTLLRRNALINIFTSVIWNITENFINILTEEGRCMRPLFVIDYEEQEFRLVKKANIISQMLRDELESWYMLAKGDTLDKKRFDIYQKSFIDPREVFETSSFEEIMQKLEENSAPVEFLDVEESNYSMIAMHIDDVYKPLSMGKIARYTHAEIHPTLMFSALASLIPFANHNHAPRNIFSCAQGKQAIGLYATNFNNRMDRMSYILHYPQQRLVKTQYTDLLRMNQLANGENLIVAIASYTGYNQDDSIIFNKDAIERGMFNISAFKTYDFIESKNESEGTRIVFDNPVKLQEQGKNIEIKKWGDYTKINDKGFPRKNAFIQEGDVMFGKVKLQGDKMRKTKETLSLEDIISDPARQNDTQQFSKGAKIENKCDIADKTIQGVVDQVFVKQNYSTHMRDAKLRLRKMKTIELGDKCASTHGQKGVCGLILPSTSMPFTKEGIVPDIIINPHAFPSRMTLGHLLECVLSKVAVYDGAFVDGTPFERTSFDYFYNKLENIGFERHGNEIMYDGNTGAQMPTSIFIGPTYYHRLKHMVGDKINYRDSGRVVNMTKQPTKGRSNQGTMRIGEMENNAIIAHGLSSFIKESMMERSDKYPFFIDNNTNSIVGMNPKHGVYNDVKNYSQVHLPYAFKLLSQELQTMSIGMKLLTTEEEKNDMNDDDDLVNIADVREDDG